jgi:hypothetical protein
MPAEQNQKLELRGKISVNLPPKIIEIGPLSSAFAEVQLGCGAYLVGSQLTHNSGFPY